jgi:hypothetical protein
LAQMSSSSYVVVNVRSKVMIANRNWPTSSSYDCSLRVQWGSGCIAKPDRRRNYLAYRDLIPGFVLPAIKLKRK